MKCKMLTIETDGTSAKTKILVDGVPLARISSIELEATQNQSSVRILVQQSRMRKDGTIETRTMKVRDEKTQKFVEKIVDETDPVLLEFERN